MPGIILIYMNTFDSPNNPVRLDNLYYPRIIDEIEAQRELRPESY